MTRKGFISALFGALLGGVAAKKVQGAVLSGNQIMGLKSEVNKAYVPEDRTFQIPLMEAKKGDGNAARWHDEYTWLTFTKRYESPDHLLKAAREGSLIHGRNYLVGDSNKLVTFIHVDDEKFIVSEKGGSTGRYRYKESLRRSLSNRNIL